MNPKLLNLLPFSKISPCVVQPEKSSKLKSILQELNKVVLVPIIIISFIFYPSSPFQDRVRVVYIFFHPQLTLFFFYSKDTKIYKIYFKFKLRKKNYCIIINFILYIFFFFYHPSPFSIVFITNLKKKIAYHYA